jgi:hypothetical protein
VDHHNVEVMEKKIRQIHITDDSHSSVHPLPPLPPNNEESQKMLSGGGGDDGGNNSDNDDSEGTPSTPRFYGSGLVGSSNNGLKIEALEASSSSTTTTTTTTNASIKRPLSAMDAARQAALRRREEAIQKLSEEDALYLEKRQKSVLIGKIEACYAQMKKVTTITQSLSFSFLSHRCPLCIEVFSILTND